VDILVNNAAIHFPVTSFLQYKWEDFEKKVLGEMKALYYPCQVVSRHGGTRCRLHRQHQQRPFARARPGFVAHSAAKSALDGFSKSLALELGPRGIRVNVVAPEPPTPTPSAFMPKEMRERVAAHTPLRRFGQPDDVAGAVLFFCADYSPFRHRHVPAGVWRQPDVVAVYSLLLAPLVPKSSSSIVHLPSSDAPFTAPLMGTAGWNQDVDFRVVPRIET